MASPKIVLANGCFDVFHYGHLRHLQAARKLGDRLIVSVTRDAFVNKGDGRPYFDEGERLAVVDALECVDSTLLVSSSLEALQLVRPDVFVKGHDYQWSLRLEDSDYCKAQGIEIAFTDEKVYSSTKILNARLRQS